MEKSTLAVVVTIAFSAVGVLGDYFLKLASDEEYCCASRSGFMLASSSTPQPLSAGCS